MFGKFLILGFIIGIVKCSQNEDENLQLLSKGNAVLATDFYQVMTKIEKGNLVISPFSLGNVLAMLRAGAKNETATDIQNVLRLQNLNETQVYDGFSQLLESLKNDTNVTLETANGIYVDKGFDIRDEFLDLLRGKFGAAAEALDFSDANGVSKKINGFVEDVTRGNILDLISPDMISAKDTKAVLVNAIYFKGMWKNAFPVNRTAPAPFYTDENSHVAVDTMYIKKKFPFAKIPELNASAAMLPYMGDRFGFVVVLPDEKNGLASVESKLNEIPLASIPEKLKPTLLQLSIPKFKLESTMDLVKNGALGKLGMKIALSRTADFSGITPSKGLYLSQVLQKAVVELSEEGTTAAAATGAILVNRVGHIGVPFDVNHPFIAFIYDYQTETVLFVVKKVI
jgi:serpin B